MYFGLSGVSFNVGFNLGQNNHEFSVGIGLAPAMIVAGVNSIVGSLGQTFSTVIDWFGSIFGF